MRLKGFLEAGAPESSSRLCAIGLCAVGCLQGLAAIVMAFLWHKDAAPTIAELAHFALVLVVWGGVALLTKIPLLAGPPPPTP